MLPRHDHDEAVSARHDARLPSALQLVAAAAQRLPVRGLPEQDLVAPVWNDVIDEHSSCDAALAFALGA
jgi:hypothetical protein